jgi:hypothetical protein
MEPISGLEWVLENGARENQYSLRLIVETTLSPISPSQVQLKFSVILSSVHPLHVVEKPPLGHISIRFSS